MTVVSGQWLENPASITSTPDVTTEPSRCASRSNVPPFLWVYLLSKLCCIGENVLSSRASTPLVPSPGQLKSTQMTSWHDRARSSSSKPTNSSQNWTMEIAYFDEDGRGQIATIFSRPRRVKTLVTRQSTELMVNVIGTSDTCKKLT